MAKITKRMKAAQAAVQPGKFYGLEEALKIVKDNAKAKFAESVDVAVRLGIDAKKSDQGVRGSSLLPHGTGKTVKVAVFCPPGEKAEAAKAAGADAVGMDDLAERMQAGEARSAARSARPDAEPERWLGHRRRRHRGEERQGRPGEVPQRQGGHHPRHHRQGQLRGRPAGGQSQYADR